jgi:glutamate--cysteine ligase
VLTGNAGRGERQADRAAKDGASVTLEPAGQLELSGAPLETIHADLRGNRPAPARGEDGGRRTGQLGFLGMGFQPKWRRDEMPWMPKGRYRIMRDYMPKVGNLGLDMMTRTCTVQVNLDYASEADMVKKFRVSLALQPIATALFADSPFTEGKPNGYLSYRSHIWTDTDPTAPACWTSCSRTASASNATSITCSTCRCISSIATALPRRQRQVVPQVPARQAAGVPGAHADLKRLGRSHDHRLPGSAAEEVPGNARRRWRPVESPLRASGVLGRPAV